MSNSEKTKDKWFSWHLSPEEPIKLRSVVEMMVFLGIVCICGLLYYRWNVVPTREYEFCMEDLSNGRVYDSDSNSVDSVRRMFTSELTCIVPMTTHDEFHKNKKSFYLKTRQLLSNEKHSFFIDYSFFKDSVRNVDNKEWFDLSKLVDRYDMSLDNLTNDVLSNSNDSIKKVFESYRLTILDSFKISPDYNPMVYFKVKESLPYFSNFKNRDSWNRKNQMLTHIYTDSKGSMTTEFFQYLNNPYPFSDLESIRQVSKIWYALNIFSPFTGELATDNPSWGRLEDISQAYYTIKLESMTMDSIIINIDFVGASEFSSMDPVPDKIGMSNILFCDPVKIFKIKSDGLKFHVRFKELENIQQIRVFTVTSIMSAFIMAFVVFVIFAICKVRKMMLMKNKIVILSVLKVVLGGLLLYNILYWSFMYIILGNGDFFSCNMLSIPLTILFLFVTCKRERKYICKILDIENMTKLIPILVVLLFMLGYSLYNVYIGHKTYEELMQEGKWGQAATVMCKNILSADSISQDDVLKLRMALMGDGNQVQRKTNLNIQDNVIFEIKDRKLWTYSIDENLCREFVIPESIVSLSKLNDRVKDIDVYNVFGFIHDNKNVVLHVNDSLFFLNYKKGLVREMKAPEKMGSFQSFVNDSIIIARNIGEEFYIYDISSDMPKMIYSEKGYNVKLIDSSNKFFQYYDYWDNSFKFVSVNKKGLFKDSLKYWKNTDVLCFDNKIIKNIATWRRLSNDTVRGVGFDKEYVYFYDIKNHILLTYDHNGILKRSLLIDTNYDYLPDTYLNNDSLLFVFYKRYGYSIYNNENLVSDYKCLRNERYYNGYIISNNDSDLVVYPITNRSDSFVVQNKYRFYDNAGLHIDGVVKGWLHGKSNGTRYYMNVVSNRSLISQSRFLNSRQKQMLINRLRKERLL